MKRRVMDITEDAPLVALLSRELDLDETQAQALIRGGAVYVSGRRVQEPAHALRPGDKVTAILSERGESTLGASHAPALPAPTVLFEDAWVLAVDKPAGWNAQPTEARVGESLVDWARSYLKREPGLVHRLDRETSGVTVFGKTPEATGALAAAFREGTARKRYLAVCPPVLEASGTIDLPLSKDPTRPGRYRASRTANGVPACTDYVRLFQDGAFALVALYPRTGRTHQLRAHLTALGAPILGDRRYHGAAGAAGLAAGRCLLHAQTLELPHPRGRGALRVDAPLPGDLNAFFVLARANPPADPPGST